MDLEDFIVSNNLLPLGSLGYVLFSTKKNGWGWNSFLEEINQGEGMEVPGRNQGLYVLRTAALIIIIYLKGYYDKFQPMGTKTLIGWMIVAFFIPCICDRTPLWKKYCGKSGQAKKKSKDGKRIRFFCKVEKNLSFFVHHTFERNCRWKIL